MRKKTRLIILLFCVVCFFVIAPVLVAYSMGYRFDFENMQVVATGGIYVRTFPTAGQITIDSKISEKPGFLANSIFVQSLLPKSHTVSIIKDGYHDYFKTLQVLENQVTKLENILLIKKDIAFGSIEDGIDYFSIAPNNQNVIVSSIGAKNINFSYFAINNISIKKTFSVAQTGKILDIKWSDNSGSALIKIQNSGNIFYYLFDTALQKPSAIRLSYLDKSSQQISFNPQDSLSIFYIKNNTLYSAKGNNSLPIINNIISFRISGANIAWLSPKGTLSNSDLSGKLTVKASLEDFTVDSKKTYEIISISGNTFLKTDDALFKFDQSTKTFEDFLVPIANYKIITSPDGKNLIYQNSSKIYLYSFVASPSSTASLSEQEKLHEIFSGSQIADLQWLNNDYIIFNDGDKIIISEIDYRGNINSVTLAQKANATFFIQQSGKLYVLTGNTLLVSEKITP